ncbi:CGNR zinc finger domain-containing protein [Streptomyces celluloflavus]
MADDLPRAALADLLARHGESPGELTERAFSEADAEELRSAVVRITGILVGNGAAGGGAIGDGAEGEGANGEGFAAGAGTDAVAESGGADDAGTDRAAHAINALLAECGARPHLSRHGGHAWHLHVDRGEDAGWADWFLASSAVALAQILTEYGRVTWGECAAPRCATLYLGTGPGSARRYCSAACASRERVAAHRRRRRAGAE